MTGTSPPCAVVAGATSLVGDALSPVLGMGCRLVGLSCDLFSPSEVLSGLAGADHAVYAAHAPRPAARLVQGSSRDLELICADNFARAARLAGVGQILYLAAQPSAEVEQTLQAHGVPLTLVQVGSLSALSAAPPPGRPRTVCSVQRMPLPEGRDAAWAAAEYMTWIPRKLRPFLRADISQEGVCSFYIVPVRSPMLVFSPTREGSTPDCQVFDISGGLLARTGPGYRGRFVFREVLGRRYLLTEVHDFVPALPWLLYLCSEALLHVFIMNAFGWHLSRTARRHLPEAGKGVGP